VDNESKITLRRWKSIWN